MIAHMKTMYLDGYEILKANQELQSFIQTGDIDLILSDAFINEYALNFVDRLKLPLVLHGSSPGLPFASKPMGASSDYASVPTIFTDFDDQMTFMQRMINAIQSELTEFVIKSFVLGPLEKRVRIDMPEGRPLSEIKRDASLLLLNSDPITNWPRQLPPSVIPIGALQTRPAKELPEVCALRLKTIRFLINIKL